MAHFRAWEHAHFRVSKLNSAKWGKITHQIAISSFQFWWCRWGWKFPIFGIDIMEKLPIDRNLEVLIDLLQMIVWMLIDFMEFHHQKKAQMCWMYVIKLIDFDVCSSRLYCLLNVCHVKCHLNEIHSHSNSLLTCE